MHAVVKTPESAVYIIVKLNGNLNIQKIAGCLFTFNHIDSIYWMYNSALYLLYWFIFVHGSTHES